MKFLKKKEFNFAKRTNSEVSTFFERMLALLPVELVPPLGDETTAKYECPALGISHSMLEKAYEVRDRMTDFVKMQSRMIETAPLQEQNRVRGYYVDKLFKRISMEKKSPEEELKEAARVLDIIAKSFKGIQRLPNDQETAMIRGLLLDMRKEENAAYVETLGLTDLLAKLEEANEAFVALTADRLASQVSRKLQGTCKEVRRELEEVYDALTMIAQAKVVLDPSPESKDFIFALNNLIDEANTVYKLRKGRRKRLTVDS